MKKKLFLLGLFPFGYGCEQSGESLGMEREWHSSKPEQEVDISSAQVLKFNDLKKDFFRILNNDELQYDEVREKLRNCLYCICHKFDGALEENLKKLDLLKSLENKPDMVLFQKSPICKDLLLEIMKKNDFDFKNLKYEATDNLEEKCADLINSHFNDEKLQNISTERDAVNTDMDDWIVSIMTSFYKEKVFDDIFTKKNTELDRRTTLYNKVYKEFYDKTVSDEFVPDEKIENFKFLQSINPFDEKLDLKKYEACSVVFLMDCFMEPCENIDSGVTRNSEGSHNRTLAEVVGSWNKLHQTPVFFHTWDEYRVNNIKKELEGRDLKANFISIQSIIDPLWDSKSLFKQNGNNEYSKFLMNLSEIENYFSTKDHIIDEGNRNRDLRYAGVDTMRLILMCIIAEQLRAVSVQIIYADKTVIPYPEMLESQEDKFKKHNFYSTQPYTSFLQRGSSFENTCMIYNKPAKENFFMDSKFQFNQFLEKAIQCIQYLSKDSENSIIKYDFSISNKRLSRGSYDLKREAKGCVYSLQLRWMESDGDENNPLFNHQYNYNKVKYPILVSRGSGHNGSATVL